MDANKKKKKSLPKNLTPTPDAEGNIKSPEKSGADKPWTSREMEEAEPFPLPEVPDDD